jgi:hypothetical protein
MTQQTVASVDDVIQQMHAIKDQLDPSDGVACFNRMYLRVTELVGQNLTEGFFEDQAFIERLDVIFAQLYFDAVYAAAAGRPVNPAWEPLFTARDNPVVWPIQFAFAGMNAHINHDLALAVVATCKERGTTPDTSPVHADYLKVNELLAKVEAEVRASFETEIIKVTTAAAEPLKHIVGNFSIARARDAAWATTQTLWHQRSLSLLYNTTLAGVTAATEQAGHLLLTPVLTPLEQPAVV